MNIIKFLRIIIKDLQFSQLEYLEKTFIKQNAIKMFILIIYHF